MNVSSLMSEISSQLYGNAAESPDIAVFLLLSCWGIAIIDSFIIGRKLAVSTNNN